MRPPPGSPRSGPADARRAIIAQPTTRTPWRRRWRPVRGMLGGRPSEVVVPKVSVVLFEAGEAEVDGDAPEIDHHRDDVPHDHRARKNQQAVVDPEELKHAHDARHRGIHALARPAPEHPDQVGDSGKRGPKTRDKPKDLRPSKSGKEQARCVFGDQALAAAQQDETQQQDSAQEPRAAIDTHRFSLVPAVRRVWYKTSAPSFAPGPPPGYFRRGPPVCCATPMLATTD